jgi:hypothetical protein
MIGSPAARGALVSAGCARRACFAVASAIGAISAAIAANITTAERPRWRIAKMDFADVNRFPIPFHSRRSAGPLP